MSVIRALENWQNLFPHHQFTAVVLMTFFRYHFRWIKKRKVLQRRRKRKSSKRWVQTVAWLRSDWEWVFDLWNPKRYVSNCKKRELERLRDKFSLAEMFHVVKPIGVETAKTVLWKRFQIETAGVLWMSFFPGVCFAFGSMFSHERKYETHQLSWRDFVNFNLQHRVTVWKVHKTPAVRSFTTFFRLLLSVIKGSCQRQ